MLAWQQIVWVQKEKMHLHNHSKINGFGFSLVCKVQKTRQQQLFCCIIVVGIAKWNSDTFEETSVSLYIEPKIFRKKYPDKNVALS